MAAANHRPALKAELGVVARDFRRMQMEQLPTLLEEYGLDPDQLTPPLVAAAMQGLAFGLVQDQVAGYDTSPDEAREAMERLLDGLEARRAQNRKR